jgi:integrase
LDLRPVEGQKPRAISVTLEAVSLLRQHKAHQAELKLQSGGRYRDHGLSSSRRSGSTRPRHAAGLATRWRSTTSASENFARLIKAAEVRPIKFHGMRHTPATLAIQAGRPAKDVQTRLGATRSRHHDDLDINAHTLLADDQATAAAVGALIHGNAK